MTSQRPGVTRAPSRGELASTLADLGLSEIRVHRDGDGQDRRSKRDVPIRCALWPMAVAHAARLGRPFTERAGETAPYCKPLQIPRNRVVMTQTSDYVPGPSKPVPIV